MELFFLFLTAIGVLIFLVLIGPKGRNTLLFAIFAIVVGLIAIGAVMASSGGWGAHPGP